MAALVLYTSKLVAGEVTGAARVASEIDILGINNPWLVADIYKMADCAGVAPLVLMPTFCPVAATTDNHKTLDKPIVLVIRP